MKNVRMIREVNVVSFSGSVSRKRQGVGESYGFAFRNTGDLDDQVLS